MDRELLMMAKQKPSIVVLNKKDLGQVVEDRLLQDFTSCSISAKTGFGIPGLKKWISSHLWQGKNRESFREIFINARHQEALQRSYKGLEKTMTALKEKKSFEYVAADLREALDALGEVNGRNVTEDLLDRIFSKFCIGK
jgi:tRNA modification GTPase